MGHVRVTGDGTLCPLIPAGAHLSVQGHKPQTREWGPGPDLATFFSNIPGQSTPAGERTDCSLSMLGQFLASVASKVHEATLSWLKCAEKFSPSSWVNIPTFIHAWRKFYFVFFFLTPCCHCNERTSTNEMSKHRVIFKIKKLKIQLPYDPAILLLGICILMNWKPGLTEVFVHPNLWQHHSQQSRGRGHSSVSQQADG